MIGWYDDNPSNSEYSDVCIYDEVCIYSDGEMMIEWWCSPSEYSDRLAYTIVLWQSTLEVFDSPKLKNWQTELYPTAKEVLSNKWYNSDLCELWLRVMFDMKDMKW